ncbi:hypothetical protein RFI_06546 [Reticulomyxa filosa]|uniref:Uncharacterized protein n=1 Tax=Reticulomyxa filosa TaxID=46433 RepID=X6NW89_RETFI|nr:hypothetical protein RFI_06546 [Reticulomyxa filosa]|eukprot:ETO30575.1 hypothetical protein RFI_06546 [Reticulomyxa filosa]
MSTEEGSKVEVTASIIGEELTSTNQTNQYQSEVIECMQLKRGESMSIVDDDQSNMSSAKADEGNCSVDDNKSNSATCNGSEGVYYVVACYVNFFFFFGVTLNCKTKIEESSDIPQELVLHLNPEQSNETDSNMLASVETKSTQEQNQCQKQEQQEELITRICSEESNDNPIPECTISVDLIQSVESVEVCLIGLINKEPNDSRTVTIHAAPSALEERAETLEQPANQQETKEDVPIANDAEHKPPLNDVSFNEVTDNNTTEEKKNDTSPSTDNKDLDGCTGDSSVPLVSTTPSHSELLTSAADTHTELSTQVLFFFFCKKINSFYFVAMFVNCKAKSCDGGYQQQKDDSGRKGKGFKKPRPLATPSSTQPSIPSSRGTNDKSNSPSLEKHSVTQQQESFSNETQGLSLGAKYNPFPFSFSSTK